MRAWQRRQEAPDGAEAASSLEEPPSSRGEPREGGH